MNVSRPFWGACVLVWSGLIWGCGEPAPQDPPLIIVEDEDGAQVAEMRVEPATLLLALGETRALDVLFLDRQGRQFDATRRLDDVVWTSSNPDVVTIEEGGELRGAGEGSAQVQVSYETFEQVVEVEVRFERWRKVSAGRATTCALDWEGDVYCWGMNNGAIIEPTNQAIQPIPEATRREGLSDIVDIAVGFGHACAADRGGHAYCWGVSFDGEVGVAGTDFVESPARVESLEAIARVEVGPYHSCALSHQGELFCWGYNGRGAVSEEAGASTARPMSIAIEDPVEEMVLSNYNTCARTTTGKVYCWGQNTFGAVNSERDDEIMAQPERVVLPARARSVALGSTAACAVLENDDLYCWGYSRLNVVGESFRGEMRGPTQITSVPALSSVHIDTESTCGITVDEELYCWGSNRHGQSGRGTKNWSSDPEQVLGEQRWKQVELGAHTICGIDSQGDLWCWGRNNYAQVGDGRKTSGHPLRPVHGDVRFSEVISGHHGTCGRVREGENWHCWGRNVETQLETSKPGDFAIPTEQRHWAPQTMVLGGYTGCGIIFVEEGQSETKCWGSNYHQALGANASGEGTYFPLWVDWKELNFQTLGISQFHGCGIAASGEMYCWGANYNGEVGMDPRLSAGAPRRVEARTDYVSVAAGFHHTCGLTEAGEIRCWGANAYGQLGRNATPAWGDPETIASEAVYVELVAGQYSTCARTAEGEVHCWGSRELFGGPTGSTTDVEPIVFGGQWDEIALYDQTLCALRDGEVSCAGRNMNGLISSGAPQLLSAFLQIPTEVEVTAVSMGSEHFCVLDAQGRAHCKGSNYSGELGDGAMVEHLEPYPAHRDL